jgi:hypothetical protein
MFYVLCFIYQFVCLYKIHLFITPLYFGDIYLLFIYLLFIYLFITPLQIALVSYHLFHNKYVNHLILFFRDTHLHLFNGRLI